MTRQRRQPLARRDVPPFTWASEYALLFGVRGSYVIAGVADSEAFTLAWRAYRDELLPQWIEDRPGTRPFAMWVVELVPKYGERRLLVPERAFNREAWTNVGILHTPEELGWQETELQYLDRHGLLSTGEREALGL